MASKPKANFKTSSSAPADSSEVIAYAKIFPPIGFARVGNSTEPDGYFIGPEGVTPPAHCQEGFSFRDSVGALKRQAARFRVYGFARDGRFVRELTCADAKITWTVQLANKKSAWFNFDGASKALQSLLGTRPFSEDGTSTFRNSHLDGTFQRIPDAPIGRRFKPDSVRKKHGLEIVPKPVAIAGRSKRTLPLVPDEQYELSALFRHSHEVYLGELRTDAEGRLLVLGGRGQSGAFDEKGQDIKPVRWIQHYANNRDWHDDISDGYVKATVELQDGRPIAVRGDSWVVVAPPDYAPDVQNIVTLRDVLEETVFYTKRNGRTAELPPVEQCDKPSYQRDILPILKRMLNYRWVNQLGLRGHGFGKPGDFSSMFGKLGDPDNHEVAKVREHIFSLIRKPVHNVPESKYPSVPGTQAASDEVAANELAIRQATANYMPPLSGDEGDREVGVPQSWLAVTHLQYARLEAWSKGNFVRGEPEGDLPAHVLVTRAALDACCGGAFYPGMELTSVVRHLDLYRKDDAFRFRTEIMEPGDLTQYMACPWQADFFECRLDWWPAQRPDDVLTDEAFTEISSSFEEETVGSNTAEFERLLFSRQRWDRGIDWRRPSSVFLDTQVFGDPNDCKTVAEYAKKRAGRFMGLLRLPGAVTLTYPERVRSPWRTQFLAQELLDTYSTRYLMLIAPAPDLVFTEKYLGKLWKNFRKWAHGSTPSQLRTGWAAFRITHPKDAVKITNLYVDRVAQAIQMQIAQIIAGHPDAGLSVEKFVKVFSTENVGSIDAANPQEFSIDSDAYKRLRLAELIGVMKDLAYVAFRQTAGDMGMVEEWHSLGVVVERDFQLRPRDGDPVKVLAQIEVDRPRYSGRTFRDYFYLIMNIERYPDFAEHSKRLARLFLAQAEEFIERLGIQDPNHPESFVEFSDANYEAKLEQIYETLRQQAAAATPWESADTRAERIRRIIGNSAFNQCDGAWLRYAANAGTSDEVRGLLFKVWSDETGNGDPAKHHGNLYTALINQLGFFPEDVRSKAYSENPNIQLSSFIGALVQLVISQHSEEFFPEILGMTLELEWEVLSLVPRVKLFDYLGIDSHFWRMHVGIDNATDGHGYAAKRAVKLYLDKVLAESGPDAMQQHWRRVWRGFVAFALGGNEIFGNDANQSDEDIDARYRSTPADRIAEIMARKKPFGNLNHSGKGLGQFRINDLFDDPDIFLEELSQSKWITPGDPDQSGLIAHLTSFEGPMYKVFDANDLAAWRDWIVWLGREGDTDSVKWFVPKGEAMLTLVTELRGRAMAAHGHARFKLETAGNSAKLPIQALFSEPDLKKLLRALANPDNGWIVPGRPEESPLLVDMARGDNPMGRALDQRFASLGNAVGRRVIYEWITAGCPILGDPKPRPAQCAHPQTRTIRRLIVQEYGLGALH